MKITLLFIILSFLFITGQAQPAGDDCAGAVGLCADDVVSATTTGASTECGGAEGDCLSGGTWGQCNDVNNSVWFTFTTNSNGGTATLDLDNISCLTGSGLDIVVVEAQTPCDPTTYTTIHCSQGNTGTTGYTLNNLSPGTTYYVQIDGTAPVGSTADCDFDISVSGLAVKPLIFFTTTPADCQGGGGKVVVDSLSGIPGPYTYSLNGGPGQSGNTFNNALAGTYPVTVTGSNGCSITTNVTVGELNNILSVDAGPDITTFPGNVVNVGGSGNGPHFNWFPTGGLADPLAPQTTFTATSPGVFTYTLTTSNDLGCTKSDQVIITVLNPILVFNAFTPNGDGINDTWEIRNAELYPEIDVSVFSRWGQRIFHQVGYSNEDGWDGTSMGKILPAGVYYYAIDLNSGNTNDEKTERLTGSITLLK